MIGEVATDRVDPLVGEVRVGVVVDLPHNFLGTCSGARYGPTEAG
jgi:hypothetical protein